MSPRVAVLLVAAVLAAGCGPTRAEKGPHVVIDDYALYNRLLRAAGRLAEGDKVTPLEDLRAQLDRPRCALSLANAPTRTMTPSDVYDRYRQSVLVLGGVYKCDKCSRWHVTLSTGFVITASGAVVTNYHVVDNKKHVTMVAMTHDGTVLPVKEVLAASKDDDTAILALAAGGRRFQPAALSTDAPVGSPVSVISHPARRFYTLTRGIVSRYFLVPVGEKRETAVPRMHITADFARGSSGGPLFNARGAVVGFVKSTASIYYDVSEGKKDSLQMVFKECIPASQVLKLIEQK